MPMQKKHSLVDYDFSSLLKSTSNKNIYQRLMILAYLKEGNTQVKTAKLLYVSAQKVSSWFKRFTEEGLEGLEDKPRSGRPRILDACQHELLKEKIEQAQSELSGGRIRGKDILQLIKDEWGVEYTLNGLYALLDHIGMSWVSARSKHPKQDEEAQLTFKKTSLN
jgi:transposase